MSWIVSPAAYLAQRPAECAIVPPRSQYVTMRDGCRIALDVYLPQAAGPFPTIALFTPYYRRFKLCSGATGCTCRLMASRKPLCTCGILVRIAVKGRVTR